MILLELPSNYLSSNATTKSNSATRKSYQTFQIFDFLNGKVVEKSHRIRNPEKTSALEHLERDLALGHTQAAEGVHHRPVLEVHEDAGRRVAVLCASDF